MSTHTLRDLLAHELRELYSAEKQLIDAIPKLRDAASSQELRQALDQLSTETQQQAARMSSLLKELGIPPSNKKCAAMEGLIEEGDQVARNESRPAIKDAAIIGALQRVEHFEMAGYGTARAFAHALGEANAAQVLDEILHEESRANEKLNQLALDGINALAAQG